MYVKIISRTFRTDVTKLEKDAENLVLVDEIILERKVEKAFDQNNRKLEWLQSTTTDGKYVYVTITAIISDIK